MALHTLAGCHGAAPHLPRYDVATRDGVDAHRGVGDVSSPQDDRGVWSDAGDMMLPMSQPLPVTPARHKGIW